MITTGTMSMTTNVQKVIELTTALDTTTETCFFPAVLINTQDENV